MVRFIFICMAFVVLSVAVTPVYFGIKGAKNMLSQSQTVAQNESTLSFDEIYETAAANAEDIIDPTILNAIAPAAGEEDDKGVQDETNLKEDEFSNGFSGKALSTLTD